MKRQDAFDIVKMAMMLWVVWGHLGLYGLVDVEHSVYMTNAKIGVNMPVFFVMAGYFAASTFRSFNWPKIFSRVSSYMWPHVTLPLVCALFGIFVLDEALRSVLWKIPFYWFLRTLAMIYLLCAVVYRVSASRASRWVLFSLIYCAMFFLPVLTRWWWCAQVIHMFPYFVFGLMVLERRSIYRNAGISIACGVIFLLAVFFQGDSSTNGMNFWKGGAYWDEVLFGLPDFIAFFARTIVGVAGSVFVLFIADMLVRKFDVLKVLAPLGRTSLGVYVIHEYPMQLIGNHFSFTPAPAWTRWLVTIAWFFVCHLLVLLIQHFRVSKFFFFGDVKWTEKILTKLLQRR